MNRLPCPTRGCRCPSLWSCRSSSIKDSSINYRTRCQTWTNSATLSAKQFPPSCNFTTSDKSTVLTMTNTPIWTRLTIPWRARKLSWTVKTSCSTSKSRSTCSHTSTASTISRFIVIKIRLPHRFHRLQEGLISSQSLRHHWSWTI